MFKESDIIHIYCIVHIYVSISKHQSLLPPPVCFLTLFIICSSYSGSAKYLWLSTLKSSSNS